MREYVTDALVLVKEPLRDFDGRYFFFTKTFGKAVGKATSSRKITSKLAGHLEPGSFAQVRFVERNGNGNGSAQIVDALRYGKATAKLGDLELLNKMLIAGEPDSALWDRLSEGNFSWPGVLALLGWDPLHAVCEICGKKAESFFVPRQEFFCVACASKLDRDALILLGNAEV